MHRIAPVSHKTVPAQKETLTSNPKPDAEGFRFPRQQLRTQARREKRQVVIGKAMNTDSRFKGAPEPQRDLFIYRVDKETTKEDLENYISQKHFKTISVEEKSHPSAKFKSFKVTIGVSQLKEMLNESVWPVGVGVRRFRMPELNNNCCYG